MQPGLVIDNADIQNESNGVVAPFWMGHNLATGIFTLKNSRLVNVTNVAIGALSSVNDIAGAAGRTITIQNVLFSSPSGLASSRAFDISMDDSNDREPTILSVPDQVDVSGYNGAAGDNFQAFYPDRAPAGAVSRRIWQVGLVPTALPFLAKK